MVVDRFEYATDPLVFACTQLACRGRRVVDDPGADRLHNEDVGKSGSDGFTSELRVRELARHKAQRVLDRGRPRERIAADEHHSGKDMHQLACGELVKGDNPADQLRCPAASPGAGGSSSWRSSTPGAEG